MALKHQTIFRAFSYLLASFLLLIILLLVSINFLVPFYTDKALKSVSESKDVDLTAERSGFSLFKGLTASGLILAGNGKETIKIKKVSIRPDYISSIREKKLIIKDITLQQPFLSISNGATENVLKLLKNTDEDEENNDGLSSKLQIKNIHADKLVIETGNNSKINLTGIEIRWNQKDRDKDEFTFDALLSVDENKDADLNGKINLNRKKKSADLFIEIDNVEKLYEGSLIKLPENLKTRIRTNINYHSDIESKAKFSFFKKQSREFGELKLNLLYSNGNLAVNNGFLELNDLLKLQMHGEIEDLSNKKLLTISSKLRVEDLSRLSKWTDFINENELSGSFESKKILLKGTEKPGNLALTASGRLKDADYLSDNYTFQDINSDLELNMNIPGNEANLKINFNTGESKIRISESNTILAEKLYTSNSSEIKYYRDSDNEIVLEGSGFDFKKAAYTDYLIEKGTIRSFKFRKEKNTGFSLDANVVGENLHSDSFRVSDLTADINIQNSNKKTVTSGNLDLDIGEIGSYNVEKYNGDFIFEDNTVRLKNSKIISDYVDNADAKLVSITLPEDGKSDIGIDLQDAGLNALDEKLESDIKNAKFTFDKNSSDLNGNIDARSLFYGDNAVYNLNFDISLQNNKLDFKNIKSDLYGGSLNGAGWINLQDKPSIFSAILKAEDINIPSSSVDFPIKKLTASIDGSLVNSAVEAKATVEMEELKISKDINSSKISGKADLLIEDETILIENGFINNDGSKNIDFKGVIRDYTAENRRARMDISETGLGTVKDIFYPLLPFEIQEGDLSGTVKTEFEIGQKEEGFDWNGKIKIKDASLYTLLSLTEFAVEGVNGVITLDESVVSKNVLSQVIGKNLTINREVFSNFLNRLENSQQQEGGADYLKVKNINYGFLNIKNIETNFEMNRSRINLNYFSLDLYDGKILGTGVYNIMNSKYNVSMLFNDISLSSISDSIPSIKDYITGRFNGMMWINDGKNIGSIDGLFSLWVVESDKEKMSIGRALLDKIGAKGRFFTGSSRRYDKGIISGYIKEGFMTFKELEISNTILGYKDLKILVDEKKNSISVRQLLSVIKEIAKRAGSGDIKLDFEKKEK